MSQYAIIENGVVTNVIEADATFAATVGAVLVGANCAIGSTYANGVFTLPVPPAPPAPTLAEAQSAQIAALSSACDAAIYAGFTSAALGATYTYPASDTDQRNLIASVTASLLPNLPSTWTTPFWCADASGNWAMRPHTAVQIQKAGLDGQAAITALRLQNAKLAAEVAAATAVDAVQAITWAAP